MKRKKLKAQLKRLEARLKKQGMKKTPAKGGSVFVPEKKAGFKIPDSIVGLSGSDRARITDLSNRIFEAAKPLPGVVPANHRLALDSKLREASKAAALALDQQIVFAGGWASSFGYGGYGAFSEGQLFLSYSYLAELCQRPEYRVISETLATEMTRKFIKIKSKSASERKQDLLQTEPGSNESLPDRPFTASQSRPRADEVNGKSLPDRPFTASQRVAQDLLPPTGEDPSDKSDKISQLEDEFKRLGVQAAFAKCATYDGFMGRSHLYLDFGDEGDRDEMMKPVGDGQNNITRAKVTKGSLKRIQPVEAVWCYPAGYNSDNPLSPDWYNPQQWFAMGQQLHASRLLSFVGHEVPDLLKPAYSFGGLSMSQMAKPYVDNWLRTRQSVSDITHAFTVFVLKTNMADMLQPGSDQLLRRAKLFTNWRDNKGLMLVDQETEDFANISAPLSTLDQLQAQAQEQMSAVSRIPTVKLLGIDAHGLNASSEGSIRVFYDMIHAVQPIFFGPNLDRVFKFAQINLWGKVDPDLTYEFEQLWSMDAKEEAEIEKIQADTDAIWVDLGALDAGEVRARIAGDEDSQYPSLDLNKQIVQPGMEDPFGMPGEETKTGPQPLGPVKPRMSLGQGGGVGGNLSSSFAAKDEAPKGIKVPSLTVVDAEKDWLRAHVDKLASEKVVPPPQPVNVQVTMDKQVPTVTKKINTRRNEDGTLSAEVVIEAVTTEKDKDGGLSVKVNE